MLNKNTIKIFALALALPALVSAHCGKCGTGGKGDVTHTHDIVDTAVEAGSFQTLVAAVKAAGLVEVLKGDGPFTVFAPTDEAFAKLPEGTVASLLLTENKDKLTAILTYHVVAGKVMAADVATGPVVTVQGGAAQLNVASNGVTINQASIVKTDIDCSNGVIHVIDQVILPPTK